MSTDWYAPNQQAVRGDQSGPGEEGTGGSQPVSPEPEPASELDEMSKSELLDYAKRLGVSPANNDMTKAELADAIREHQA